MTRFLPAVVLSLPIATALLGLPTAGAEGEGTPRDATIEELARAYGFDEGEIERIRAGKIVLQQLRSASDSELALSAMAMTRKKVDWHFERIETGRSADPTLTNRGLLEGDGRASLEALEIPDQELDRLAVAEVGDDYNFTETEVGKLRAAASTSSEEAGRRQAVLAAFREILAARFVSYREGGLQSIEPYDRGDGDETNPARQLERALKELRGTREFAPHVVAAITEHPKPAHPDVRSQYGWSVNRAEGRVLVSLHHRVYGLHEGAAVAIEHRFFVHYTLNSMQVAAIALPIPEGTAILYANRTATDLVTGFGSAIAKRIGLALMRREVDRLVDATVEAAE